MTQNMLSFDLLTQAAKDISNPNLWMRLFMIQNTLKIDDKEFQLAVDEGYFEANPELKRLMTKKAMDEYYSEKQDIKDQQGKTNLD